MTPRRTPLLRSPPTRTSIRWESLSTCRSVVVSVWPTIGVPLIAGGTVFTGPALKVAVTDSVALIGLNEHDPVPEQGPRSTLRNSRLPAWASI